MQETRGHRHKPSSHWQPRLLDHRHGSRRRFLGSPDGLQSGAKQVAAAAGIQEIKLDPLSTTSAYFGEWLGSLRIGFTDDLNVEISEHLSIQLINKDGNMIQTYDSDKR